MKSGALFVLALVGCGVGQGTGQVKGPLTIEDCGGPGKMFPDPKNPQPYDLEPKFFSAEQLLDLSFGRVKSNRLIIRLQNTGRQRETNDVLRFDIPDALAAARCVRGEMNPDGTPAYDTENCFVSGGQSRLRVGTNALVRSYLTPNFKCSTKIQLYDRVGTAISDLRVPNDGQWASYIVFDSFGNARGDHPPGPEFKIEIDERLNATDFHLTIEDDAVVSARLDPLKPPIPHSHINGSLDGKFDFDMQRGQGAQTFP
jgi:hypothetical protein